MTLPSRPAQTEEDAQVSTHTPVKSGASQDASGQKSLRDEPLTGITGLKRRLGIDPTRLAPTHVSLKEENVLRHTWQLLGSANKSEPQAETLRNPSDPIGSKDPLSRTY